MSIWKNTEVRRTALWLLLATAVCSVAAALLYPICGLHEEFPPVSDKFWVGTAC